MGEACHKTAEYRRRQPELTPCYRIIQDHIDTFIQARTEEGRPLPEYVLKEFDAYLKCGILAFGFLRLVCQGCDEEHVVPFSCKKRGFCPSCCAKRMAETRVHLLDNVLPLVPYRQFVISFPMAMRYWLHMNKKFLAKVHRIIIDLIHGYYTSKALALGIKNPAPGSISFTQRWGSALNLTPHFHILCPDGVYTRLGDQPHFRSITDMDDEDVAQLVQKIADIVKGLCVKLGYLNESGEIVQNPALDPLFQEDSALYQATVHSIAGKIAFGPNTGQYVRRLGQGFGYDEEVPLAKGKRCFSVNGFSLHANTAINTHSRDRLASLVEYLARGPLSNERLTIRPNGDVELTLKSKWKNGTTHLLFSPEEFISSLVALIPPPRTHLVRWGGVFAPHSPFRRDIVLRPEKKKGFQFRDETETEDEERAKVPNYSWAKMLAKVFKVDLTKCVGCGGDLVKVAAITDPIAARRYLRHVGLPYDAPARAPPRSVQGEFDFEHQPFFDDQY